MKNLFVLLVAIVSILCYGQQEVTIPTDYSSIEEHVAATPKEATESLEKLAEYLTSTSGDPFLRLRAIYSWTTANIEYDWFKYIYMEHLPVSAIPKSKRGIFTALAYKWYAFSLNAGLKNQNKLSSSEKMIKHKKGICQDYTQLINDLCFEAGIKSINVTGYLKNGQFIRGDQLYSSNHAWNAVAIAREWHMLDATNNFWITEKDSIDKHMLPADPIWQLEEEPISVEEFSADSLGEYYWDPYDFMDSISYMIGNEPIEIQLQSSLNAKRFNDQNNKDLAYAYFNHANFYYQKAKTTKNDYDEEMKSYKTAEVSFDSAKVYLKAVKKIEVKNINKLNKTRIKAEHKVNKDKIKSDIKFENSKTKKFERDKKDYLKLVKTKYKTLIDSTKNVSAEHIASIDPTQKVKIKKVKAGYKSDIDSLRAEKVREVEFIERYNEEEIKAYQKEQSKVIKTLDKTLKQEEKRFNKTTKSEIRRFAKEKKKNKQDTEFAKKLSKTCKEKHKKMKNAYYTKG